MHRDAVSAPSMLLFLLVSIAGCDRPNELTPRGIDEVQVPTPAPISGEAPMHGDHKHHHAFAAPQELAKKWNTPERDAWQRPEEIVSALALRPGARVADLGAGTGYMVAHLSKAVGQDGTVIAIDAETAMIEYLTMRTAELGPATILPHKVSLDDPELAPASLDGVLTLDTWHHVDGREAYARKVFDGLKPGGRFVVAQGGGRVVDSEPES